MRLGDALSLLVERADLIEAAGRTFLLMEVEPYLMDYLASYRADREDMEDDGDSEPDYDNEYDYRKPVHDPPPFRTVTVGNDSIGRGSDGSMWRAVDLRELEYVTG